MSNSLVIFFELFTTIMAALVGFYWFKHLNGFFKLMLLQVVIYLAIDVVAVNYGNGNHWLFNMYMLFETVILLVAAVGALNTKHAKNAAYFSIAVICLVFVLDLVYATGFWSFAYHTAIAQAFVLSAFYIAMVYTAFWGKVHPSVSCVAVGIILYFVCIIPYLSAIYFIQEKNALLNTVLFQYIVVGLAHVRYLALCIGFIWHALKFKTIKQSYVE